MGRGGVGAWLRRLQRASGVDGLSRAHERVVVGCRGAVATLATQSAPGRFETGLRANLNLGWDFLFEFEF